MVATPQYSASDDHAGNTTVVADTWTTDEKASPTTSNPIETTVRRQLKRKLDTRLVVWAFFGYFASFIDRVNLPSAYISGMKEDLQLESVMYNWAFNIMNIGCNVAQIPLSLLLPRVYPRWFLPSLCVAWGIIQTCMAFVTNHQGLLALRFCLGLAESVFQPGIVFLFGSWYTEAEVAKRVTTFRAAMGVSSAVGGLIAGGIVQTIADRGGLRAWQWLFLIEGLLSLLIGLVGYAMVPNYPHQATSWISEHERTVHLDRQASADVVITGVPFKNVVASPYAWLMTTIFTCGVFLLNILQFYVIILNDMGYDSAFSNYMIAPLCLFGALTSTAIGWSADWFNDCAVHLGLLSVWGTLWSIVYVAVDRGNNPAAVLFVSTYALVVLMGVPSLGFVWVLRIYKRDPNSRAMVTAMINGIGLLIPSFATVKLWLVTDSPVFWLGKISNVAFGGLMIVAVIAVWYLLRIEFRLPSAETPKEQDCKNGKENDISDPNEVVV